MDSTEEIKRTLLDYYEAFHKKEWDKFAGYLTDNFRYFTDKTTILNKEKFVDFLSKDEWQSNDYKVYDIDIHVPNGCDTAWGTYKTSFTGIFREKEMTVTAIETSVFVKENGGWKIGHHHTSNKA